MKQHLDIMRDVLNSGDIKTDRTGTGTIAKFGGQMKFSLQHGIWPIPTTREVDHTKISSELEWMIRGIISVQWLKDLDNNIWNSWAGEKSGTIGPMYGEQWRNWNAGGQALTKVDFDEIEEGVADALGNGSSAIDPEVAGSAARNVIEDFMAKKRKLYQDGGRGGVDQLQHVINELKINPDSRRICVSVWHAGLLPDAGLSPKQNADAGKMALAPCHSMWQVNTAELSDIEILQQIAYREDDFQDKIASAMTMHGVRTSTEVQEFIAMNANMYLKDKGMLDIDVSKQYNFSVGRNLPISDAGKWALQAWREMGRPTRKLSLLCFARSQDLPLGTVFNVGMYSLLAHVLAQQTNMLPWEYTHFMGDYHIYSNQVEFVEKQLDRTPMKPAHVLVDPYLKVIDLFDHKKVQVVYSSHPKIIYPRAAV